MAESTFSGNERTFHKDDIIVSKTDPKGIITYANDIFLEIADYTEEEIIGKPHKIIRHPNMPRCVFKLLWDKISAGEEIFAYVVNRAKNGDYYWVLAHVTPTIDKDRNILGYHSNRRVPSARALEVIKPLYADLLATEQRQSSSKAAIEASTKQLMDLLEKQNKRYDQFIYELQLGA